MIAICHNEAWKAGIAAFWLLLFANIAIGFVKALLAKTQKKLVIILATTNEGKVNEFNAALESDSQIEFLPISNFLGNTFEVDETGQTFIENSELKAFAAAKELTKLSQAGKLQIDAENIYCLADDSGLVVEALVAYPGIYSGRYLRNPTYLYPGSKLTKDDLQIIQKRAKQANSNAEGIFKLLYEIENQDNRKCHFVCSLVLVNLAGENIFKTEEYWHGKIASEPKGDQGFAYDPIVIPEGYEQTVAELGNDIKNQESHRAQALKALCEFLAAK